MQKIQHFAFKQDNPSLCLRLLTDAHVFDISGGSGRKGAKVTALWDTGATVSAITPALAKKMNLVPFQRTKVVGVHSASIVDVARVSIGLPNTVIVEKVNVVICNLDQGFDLIIGMDIISLNDFSISNGEGKTLFSFVSPP